MIERFTPSPQVGQEHYETNYDDRRRWSSYWLQISLAKQFEPGPYVEIGIGTGVTTSYMRSVLGASVTTVDIDPDLEPDIVADITSLPFPDGHFSCAIACEVLEHMPFDRAREALKELRRVANHAVISVPNSNRFVLQLFGLAGSRRKRLFNINLGRLFPRPVIEGVLNGEHYWELESAGYTLGRFRTVVAESGWSLSTEFRNPDYPYHHFFVLD